MAESTSKPHVPQSEPSGLTDASATFEKMRSLLEAKDDTSRFVGLALLKSVLDNGHLAQDPERVRILWEALSPKFLDRLLRAHSNDKFSKTEAQDMVDLAVAVLHIFSNLLPEVSRKKKRLVGRTELLIKALVESPQETTKLTLQTILTIVSQPEGALELLSVDDLSPLTEIAAQDARVLDIFAFTWANASAISSEAGSVRLSINKIMPILLNVFRGTDAVTLISFVGDLLPKLTSEAIPPSPKWLGGLVLMIRKLIFSKPTLASRAAYTQLASTLLQVYPTSCPTLLFKDDSSLKRDSKPFSFLFINLLLIDLRSSFPSLLSKLNSSDYPSVSLRLAAALDIISSFIGFLLRSLDNELDSVSFSMPPDLLLRLRKDIAETMSLTIEYLRDRWDASVAGASGLHPSARAGTSATSEGTRLTLTWESMTDSVNTDPLILAGIRTLAIWIREDENENLRNESAGLMDMLVELYKTSSPPALDFRYPILLALEGIMSTDDGVEGFLGQDGWRIVAQDLEAILRNIGNNQNMDGLSQASEASRGLEIVRILLTVLDHHSTSSRSEDWMTAITSASSMKVPSDSPPPKVLEFQIAMLQLSAALLSEAPVSMQKRYASSSTALSGILSQLKVLVNGISNKTESRELLELLEDVALDLGNLRVSG